MFASPNTREFCESLSLLLLLLLSLFLLLESFSHQHSLMVFHWGLSDNKSPQLSRTLLSILANLKNAVVWTVSTRTVISNFSSPLVTLPIL